MSNGWRIWPTCDRMGAAAWQGRLCSRYAGEAETELYRQAAQAQDGPSPDDMLLVYLVELDTTEDVTAA